MNFSVFGKNAPPLSVKSEQDVLKPQEISVRLDDEANVLSVSLPEETPRVVRVSIIDVLGKTVVERNLEDTHTNVILPVRSLPAGYFICRVAGNGFLASQAFVVIR